MDIDLSQYVRIGRYDLPEPTRTAAPANNVLAQEVSAITYDWDTDTLFVVGDGGTAIVQIDKQGNLIDTMTLATGSSPQGTEFYDPEGLTYIGNGQFVMTEERDRNAVLFTYQAGTTLTRAAAQTAHLGTNVGNIGLEGLSYDPQTGGYIFVKEKSPEGIFQTTIDFALDVASNGSATTVNSVDLFNPASLNLVDFADVYAMSNIASTVGVDEQGNLLVLSQESARILEVDRAGNILSSLNLVSDPGNPLDIVNQQHEGITMDANGYLYVVSENGGGDINHPQLWVFAPASAPNQAPTAVSLINPVTTMLENSSTAMDVKVAGIALTDDGIGTNVYSLSGADAAYFRVDSTGLYIKAGTVLDYETKSTFNVTVNVDDSSVGATPDASTSYSLNLVNVLNEGNGPMLYISEVAPWSSGNSAVGADWFELTNTGTSAIDITGWKVDDNSNSFASSVALNGITSVGAGESVIFIEGGAAQVTAFINTWFNGVLPGGLQIGTYSGSSIGLSTSGDAVNIYNAAGVLQANVTFGTSDATSPYQTFDNAQGINNGAISLLSSVGANAAFTASAEASIGSPGEISLNAAPIAADDSLSSVAEDSGARTISFASLLANDLAGPPNEASQTLTITSVSNAVGGTAVISGTDVIFTPNTDFNGQASFEYTVQDNGQNYGANAFLTDVGAASFTVTSVNDAPALTGPQGATEHTLEDIAETLTAAQLLTGFTDVDGDTLSVVNLGASSGSVVDNGNGTWTVTQAADFNGTVSLTYDVTDGNGGTVAATNSYIVDPVNDAPAITSNGGGATASINVAENIATVTTVQANDVDGPVLSYSIAGGADAALFQIDANTGALSFVNAPNYETPADAGADNVYDVTVRASDGSLFDDQDLSVSVTDIADTHSSQSPYLLPSTSNVTFQAIMTTGDVTSKLGGGSYLFGGIPDGLGAFDNGDGTVTVLVNQELGNTVGTVRDHGAKGAYVSQYIIDKATLSVISGHDAIQQVYLFDDASNQFVQSSNYAISRLCSADLAPQSAYYWVDSSDGTAYGTQSRIFMTGEESGTEGKEFAVFVTGPDAGKAFEFADCGLFAWENNLASPYAQKKTITIGQDDGQNGQIYVYVGDKQATGTEFEKAGLDGGHLYGIKVDALVNAVTASLSNETDANPASGRFSMFDQGVVGVLTGAQLDAQSEANGVTSFQRPEDGHWDPTNPNVYWFVTTASATGQSRLYKMTFDDITQPELGGTIQAVLDSNQLPVNGGVGPRMMDNITVGADGKILIQEDIGNNAHLGRVLQYDPATDTLVVLGSADPSRFLSGGANFLTQDEESSGVIDVTDIFGDATHRTYLLDMQSHKPATGPNATTLVEGGQLLLMTVTNNAPVITSDGGGATAVVNVIENTTAVTTVVASDDATDTVIYSIAGGADAALFSINASTGALSFISAPDYQAPTDTDNDNVYDVIVRASDGYLTDDQAVAVTVTTNNHAPALTGSQALLANGTEDVGYTVTLAQLVSGFTDTDGDTLAVVNLNASNGTVVDNLDGTYTITPAANYNGAVTLSYDVVDGNGGTVAATLGYTLNAVNDAPVALALSNASIAENSANGTQVGTLLPTDADVGDTFTYTLLDNAGGRFAVNAATGAVTVANGSLLDYETATHYDIVAKVTDAAGTTYSQTLTINLTNVVESHNFFGTSGVDVFTATSDDNWFVRGKGGADILTTLGGNDTIYGDGGNDTISAGAGNDLIYVLGSGGFDAIDGGAGTDVIKAGANNVAIGLTSITGIEQITNGGYAGVSIVGSGANDSLDFSSTILTGIAAIAGKIGNDSIIGSMGNDTIIGGVGADTLTGGTGNDHFVYEAVKESGIGAKADHILDFTLGDMIDLSAIDANGAVAGNQAFTFIGNSAFTGLGQLRLGTDGSGHVALFGNVSGNLAADFEIILDNNHMLQASDFIL